MRNSEFIKSTNTNSQTRRNSEELQEWESCTVQLAPAAPKEEATATLNWTTFSMQRLTHQKTPAISADFFFCRFTKSNCPVFILSFSWRLTARKWKKIPIIILSSKSAKKHSPHQPQKEPPQIREPSCFPVLHRSFPHSENSLRYSRTEKKKAC